MTLFRRDEMDRFNVSSVALRFTAARGPVPTLARSEESHARSTMARLLLVAALLLCAAGAVLCGKGTDMSTSVSESAFNCLASDGFAEFAVPRCWHSSGIFDSSACQTTKNAKAAGMTPHVYLFPCPTCSASCGQQVAWAHGNLSHCSAPYDYMWIDIEDSSLWHSSQSSNQQCFTNMINKCSSLGIKCGTYASASQWDSIMGSSFHGGKSTQLWYPHYDGSANCNDFSSFGGWTSPRWKQYAGTTSKCGASVDLNVHC